MQLIPKYWTLTVAYGCVTFMAGLKTSQSFVGRPLGEKKPSKTCKRRVHWFNGTTWPPEQQQCFKLSVCPDRLSWVCVKRFHSFSSMLVILVLFLLTPDLERQECALSFPYALVGGVCSVRWWVRNVWILERKGSEGASSHGLLTSSFPLLCCGR